MATSKTKDAAKAVREEKDGMAAETIDQIAKMERVHPAIVKATAMSVGNDRRKLVAAIRASKA